MATKWPENRKRDREVYDLITTYIQTLQYHHHEAWLIVEVSFLKEKGGQETTHHTRAPRNSRAVDLRPDITATALLIEPWCFTMCLRYWQMHKPSSWDHYLWRNVIKHCDMFEDVLRRTQIRNKQPHKAMNIIPANSLIELSGNLSSEM